MLADSHLAYLFVYVTDLPRARAFYEDTLGLGVLEEDAAAVKYETGQVMLALNRAADYGLSLDGQPDESSLIVFHVQDIDAARADLEERGVSFAGPTERYDIGATAAFFDPDGHGLMLYEPSEESMTWPSGETIRAILSRDRDQPDGSPGPGLNGRPLLYLFLFVRDTAEAEAFYRDALGLRLLEVDPVAGVAKYDVGSLILATHLSAGEGDVGPPVSAGPKSIAPTFLVRSIDEAVRGLADRGVAFPHSIARVNVGGIARFQDPNGHLFYLYEPSSWALTLPSGPRIGRLQGRAR